MKKSYRRSVDALDEIVEDTASFFRESLLDCGLRTVVDLAIEEIFVNMVRYNQGGGNVIDIEMLRDDDGIRVCLTDFDVERFDPTVAPDVDIDAPLERRRPGGLGRHLVLNMVDRFEYDYRNGCSHVSFLKKHLGENT